MGIAHVENVWLGVRHFGTFLFSHVALFLTRVGLLPVANYAWEYFRGG